MADDAAAGRIHHAAHDIDMLLRGIEQVYLGHWRLGAFLCGAHLCERRVTEWWRTGVSLRQYDLDWGNDGHIYIYDNNRRENRKRWDGNLPESDTRFSRIVKIDPRTMETAVVYDGKEENFYNSRHGKLQLLANGNILFSSPEQGRILEVDKSGETVFELVNRVDKDRVFKISEARWRPPHVFDDAFHETRKCH